MVSSGAERDARARTLPRVARRVGRRLRRVLTWRGFAMLAVVTASLIVVILAVYAPAARTGVFRTDAVLRAMGVPAGAGVAQLVAAAEPVPSLSVSPRFVLPLVRDDRKRMLAVAPVPLPHHRDGSFTGAELPPMPSYRSAARRAGIGRPSRSWRRTWRPRPPTSVQPPPAVVAKPRPPVAPLTTAVLITPTPPRHAQAMPVGQPMLALVIDDLGPSVSLTRRAMRLPRPVTLAFLPYASDLDELTAAGARARPRDLSAPADGADRQRRPWAERDPGRARARRVPASPRLGVRSRAAGGRREQPYGQPRHLRSGQHAEGAAGGASARPQLRRQPDLAAVGRRRAGRSNWACPTPRATCSWTTCPTTGAILRQLAEAEHLARRRGQALAIGHPYSATLAVLEAWIPAAEARGLRIVRAGDLIARSRCRQPQALTVSACTGSGCPPAPAC